MSGLEHGRPRGGPYPLREIAKVRSLRAGAIKFTLEDVILLLLRAGPRPIEGKTRLMKEVFLALGDIFPWAEAERVDFRPHRFGPYSERVYGAADQLAFVNKVRVEGGRNGGVRSLAITPRGREHIGAKFDALPPRTRERLVQKRAEWDALTPAGIRDSVNAHYETYRLRAARGVRGEAEAPDAEGQTARIALFLGAGASAPYGMPTTRELLARIRGAGAGFPRKDLLDPDRFPDIEHVLSALNHLISFAESSAGRLYAESGGGGYRDDGGGDAPESIIAAGGIDGRDAYEISASAFKAHVSASRKAIEFIERVMARDYSWDPSNDRRAAQVLGPLFDLARSKEGHVTVFTTNYDAAVESYCGGTGRQFECIDGFSFDWAAHTRAWQGWPAPDSQDCRTRVHLYKLHGSLGWKAGKADGRGGMAEDPYTGVLNAHILRAFMRPPLDAKDEEARKGPYAAILRRFGQALSSFDACIVIGYSFRDPYISKELVKFAERGKALVVLSPTAATDFEANVLEGMSEFRAWDGWGTRDIPHGILLSYSVQRGIAYTLNKRLDEGGMDSTIDALESAIRDGTRFIEMQRAVPVDG